MNKDYSFSSEDCLTFSVKETAQKLGTGVDAVYNIIKDPSEKFPYFYIGKNIRVNARKLQEWVDMKSGCSN